MTLEQDLAALYRAAIMDHARAPKNCGPLGGATHEAKGHNPLCGDHVTVRLACEGEHIHAAMFEGAGCALSIASASMLTEAIKERSVDAARALHAAMTALFEGRDVDVGELSLLAAARAFPARLKCVTLAWQTLGQALDPEPR